MPSSSSSSSSSSSWSASPVLRFEGVTYVYPGGQEALREVTFTLHEGQRVSVVGPNGGGKTTLVKLALGLIKPTRGRIETCGHAPHVGCRLIGYLPQQVPVPAMPATVADVVRMGLMNEAREAPQAVPRALAQAGVADLATRPFARLSGGERQRVLLARALVARPRVLFLDEPVAHLDPAAARRFRALLAELPADLTILTVTHDLSFVEADSDLALCVNRGVQLHPVAHLNHGLHHVFETPMAVVDHQHCLGPERDGGHDRSAGGHERPEGCHERSDG